MFRSIVAASLLAALVSFQGPDREQASVFRYPAVRHETCVRFYHLKGKLDPGKLNKAVRVAEFDLIYGPKEAASRPSNSVIAVEVPADLKSRDVERALKKAGVKVQALDVFLFRGRIENGFPTFGAGLKPIDYMLGISGDIKWCDLLESRTLFFCVEGELDAETIEELYVKLQRPLGDEDATLGELVHDRFLWTLSGEVDEKQAKKLKKAIEKLDGIVEVEFEGSTMSVKVAIAELPASGRAQGFEGEKAPPRGDPPRATAFTNELWDLLVKAELTPIGS